MASTQKYELTADEWVQVSDEEGTVAIQPGTSTNIYVYISDSAPTMGDEDTEASPGFIIGRGTGEVPEAFSASGLDKGALPASVWLRSTEGETSVVVITV